MLENLNIVTRAVDSLVDRSSINFVQIGIGMQRVLHDIDPSMALPLAKRFVEFVMYLSSQFSVFDLWDANGRSEYYFFRLTGNDIVLNRFGD